MFWHSLVNYKEPTTYSPPKVSNLSCSKLYRYNTHPRSFVSIRTLYGDKLAMMLYSLPGTLILGSVCVSLG